MDCSPPCSSVHGDSPGKNNEVSCRALLQGIFPTQVSCIAGRFFTISANSSVQSLICVQLSATPCTTALQASLSITNSWSPLKPISNELVMPSKHLMLCHPLLLLPSIFPSIRVFCSESTLRMRWPKYWSFSFSISLYNKHPGLISIRMDWWISLQSKGLSRVFSNTTVQKHQFFSA